MTSLAPLAAVVRQAGFTSHIEDSSGGAESLVVEAGTHQAAALNRLAMEANITLIHISERARSLEEAFLS